MEKNWLIRTHSNQILGPVTKEKIVELFNKSALADIDEVCTGNGFWFFVRETELVQKYVFGEDTQGFNPVTETVDVLTAGERDRQASAQEIHEVDDITNVVKLDSKQTPATTAKAVPTKNALSKEAEPTLYPKDDDLAFPDLSFTKTTPNNANNIKKK